MDNGSTAVMAAGEAIAVELRAGRPGEPARDTIIRPGPAERFEAIVRRHERRVLALARRLLGRLEDAEDAAQESFLRLYRALDRLDPDRPVLPYLYRTTVNVCRDLQTRGRVRLRPVRLDDVAPGEEPKAGGADPQEAAGLAEERRIAAAALRALPDKQRAAPTAPPESTAAEAPARPIDRHA